MNSHAVWQGVLGEIEITMPSSSFSAWFNNSELEIISEKEVVVIASNIFTKTQLEKRFHNQIVEALEHNGVNATSITYSVKSSTKKPRVNREAKIEEKPSAISPTTLITPSQISHSSNLNPRYTFDSRWLDRKSVV